ncbi:MAG: hypothetical protein ACK5G9_07860 [Akkermansiaceae bacterium]|jgi:hypothetical protein
MVKKVKVKKKGSKWLLSLIFHLVVLVIMVYLYDTARAMLGKGPLPPPPKVDLQPKPTAKSGDGTFEQLMAEKRRKAKEGPEIPEDTKKEDKDK